MTSEYDVIVVGARCAGAPTAMLLARRGYRVLVLDRATFPSDTVSTHVIHPTGIAALRRWGVLDQVVASGCPPIERYSVDFGPLVVSGTPHPRDGISTGYAPRRTVLDKVLVDAAREAGAEVREGFSVESLVFDGERVVGIRGHDERGTAVERAAVVVGADGRYSSVAQQVGAPQYHDKPTLQVGYYTYFSDLPVEGFETFVREDRGWGAAPTNDGLTMLVVGWPVAEAKANKLDVEGNFFKSLELAPDFARRVGRATRRARFTGGSAVGYFRRPYGPGWALVGDAGYHKDPITAQGMSDAFRDAERCATALDEALTGARDFDEAMADYQRERDTETLPMYEFTAQLAALEPPPPEMQQLLAAIAGNQEAMDGFVSVIAGTLSPPAFFDPANIARLLAGGAEPPPVTGPVPASPVS